MSLESILAGAKRSKTKKRSGKGFAAHDSKYTGEEPVWDGWETWTVDKFMGERNRALNFYNYYSNSKDLKPKVLEWMQVNGYTKDEIRAVKRAPDYFPGTTVGSLCSSMLRGMTPFHPHAQEYHDRMPGVGGIASSDEEFVREKIRHAIKEGLTSSELGEDGEKVKASSGKAESPMTLLKKKIGATILMDLDILIDSWNKVPAQSPVPALKVYDIMKAYGLPAQACASVDKYLKKYLEYYKALASPDPANQDYVNIFTDFQIKNRISTLEGMLNDLGYYNNSAKATRKPKEKKAVSVVKQISRLKYKQHDGDFKLTSINPSRIVNSRRLLVFNTKNRALFDFVSTSTSGLQIKGSTLTNVDLTLCKYKRLRKPEITLPLMQNSSEKSIEKTWQALTTVEGKAKPRINKDMILLRVFEQ